MSTPHIRDFLHVGSKVEIIVPGNESICIKGIITVRYHRITDGIANFFFNRVDDDTANHFNFNELEHFFFNEEENCWRGFIVKKWMTINVSVID